MLTWLINCEEKGLFHSRESQIEDAEEEGRAGGTRDGAEMIHVIVRLSGLKITEETPLDRSRQA